MNTVVETAVEKDIAGWRGKARPPVISADPTGATDYDAVRAQVNRLEVLGTPDNIANYFRREKITGTQGKHRECIIAQWLSTTCGPVSVGHTVVLSFDCKHLVAFLPLAAESFIGQFDRGYYPDLIRL